MAILYRHIRLDKNEPFYIGIGKHKTRPYSKKRNTIWNSIVSKTEYEIEVLFDDLTWEQACEKEIEFIKLYGRIDLGTGCLANLTDGGDKLANLSELSRKKIREVRAKQTFTEESNIKRSQKLKGRTSPLKGRKLSEERKKQMSDIRKGRVFSDEHRKKLSEAAMGNKNGIQNLKQYQVK
jgi:hypothetical protein